jgi:hypothetical protein
MSEKAMWTAPGWQELFSHFAALVGAAMCSAFNAVHMTAGHNASADQVLTNNSHECYGTCGCPDRRIDRLCITCRSPSQPSRRASCPARLFIAQARRVPYRSPLAIMAQTIRAILLASAIAATLVGRRASKAVSQGRCVVP